MQIVENVSLTDRSSLRCPSIARYGAELSTESDVRALSVFARERNLPLYIFGHGTNTIFGHGVLPIVAGFMCMRGITVIHETNTEVGVRVAAGERWDDVVAWTVAHALTGIEALSHIPGTAGAAPIQNIGAYGIEFKDVCTSVTVYDTESQTIYEMPRAACAFTYRNSIFKKNPGAFIVLAITIVVSRGAPRIPEYADVVRYFGNTQEVSVAAIRDAIISIRSGKLPDYHTTPNVGSFFQNPILDQRTYTQLQATVPDIPGIQLDDGTVKVFAGWLIERAGLKGKNIHGVIIDARNALVLTNPEHVSAEHVLLAQQHIVHTVCDQFGITLEREPILIST